MADLVKEMGDAYPELKEKQVQIEEALKNEESRFAQTLETGMALLEKELNTDEFLNIWNVLPKGEDGGRDFKLPDFQKFTAAACVKNSEKTIVVWEKSVIDKKTIKSNDPLPDSVDNTYYLTLDSYQSDFYRKYLDALHGGLESQKVLRPNQLNGSIIFKLYDTYGFPYDLTADICRERNVAMDEEGFNREMEAQRARARAAQSFKANAQLPYEGQDTEFKGYSERQTESKVLALYKNGEQVNELNEGDEGAVVIDFTPFYAESGGQVGDVGYIFAGENRFEVRDTQKIKAAVFGQFGVQTSGRLKVGDSVTAKVDDEIRNANMRNHSATHLMHKALRDVLGEHVEQKGSLVTAESTRFDISHPQAVTAEEIAEVERRVNEAILANVAVNAAIMSMEDAQKPAR